MASCSSSFDGEDTRTWSAWIAACTFLSFRSFRNLTMSLAASVGMPCWSVTTRRTVSLAARSLSPGLRFLVGTPRRTMRPWRISQTAFILKSSSATRVRVFSFALRSIAARDPLKSYRCAISFRAWLTALSTSCRSTPEVISKEATFDMMPADVDYINSARVHASASPFVRCAASARTARRRGCRPAADAARPRRGRPRRCSRTASSPAIRRTGRA